MNKVLVSQTVNQTPISISSVSDDNSSIQSSPWQRDHCWKQTTPRRNISNEMSMYFHRSNDFALSSALYKIAQKKRRRPYDTVTNIPNNDNELVDKRTEENENKTQTRVKEEPPDGGNGSCGDDSDDKSKVINEIKIKMEKLTNNRRPINKLLNRPKLCDVLQKLIDRVPGILLASSTNSTTTNVANHLIANNSRIDINNHQHMSPRKRILRELEQVSLDEFESTKKKPRTKTVNNHTASIEVSVPSEPPVTISATTNSHSSLCNGNGTIPTTQAVQRPVSSYSITSLLGHNNNNNSIKNDSGANNNKGSPVQFHQTPQKSSSAFSSRKKSPSYNPNNSIKTPSRNATPSSLQNNFNRSPSTSSPINYGRNNHSPDLSPSPEQTYARYRPYNVQYPPSSAGFHPYMSVSSRGSLSPPYSTESALYLSNLSTRSPSQQYASTTSAQESSSPLSYSRYSPSGYSQISPQHFSSNKTSMYSASTNSNSTNKSKVATSTSIKKKTELSHDAQSIIGGGSSRTVPTTNKNSTAHRQQYGSPVSSVNSDTKTNELFYKPMSTSESSKKDSDRSGIKSTVPSAGSASSPEVSNQHYEKDYQPTNNTNNSSVLSRLDIESNALRSNHAQAAYQQNMMYMFPPSHHAAVGIAPPPGSYIPPPSVYYPPMAVAGFYRDWMHYASAPPSRLSNPLLASYANMHPNPPMTTNGPWGSVPNNNQPADNILSFRMKQEETNSGECFSVVVGIL